MNIRLAQKTDASSLAAISMEVWVGTYLREGVNAFFADYALANFTAPIFEAMLDDDKETIWVSENQTGIDGYIRITNDKSCDLAGCSNTEITTLYVQPRHHGKRIGQLLLKIGLSHCAEHNISCPWLAVNAENENAIGFYKKHGFSIAGETHFKINDEAYLNHIMAFDFS